MTSLKIFILFGVIFGSCFIQGAETKCKAIWTISNGWVRLTSVERGGKAKFLCDKYYNLVGNPQITCNKNGMWSGPTPYCERISCPRPTLPANSQLVVPVSLNTSEGATDWKQLYLICKPGYYKVGSSQKMTCSSGQWQLPASFKCLPISCGDPGVPRNGGKNGLTYHFKNKVEFYCNKCYKLIGDSYRYCNADQAWSGQQPVCQRVDTRCKLISSIPNGWVRVMSNECGGKAEFSCDRYYNLVGNSKIICNDNGTWSAATPYCKPVTCPRLNISKTIIAASISGYKYGSRVRFSCKDSNFTLSNNTVISCRANGEWSAEVPQCLAPCHVNATGNLVSKKIYQHGSKADLKCKDGFRLSGVLNDKMPVCFNGKWKLESSMFPYCEKDEHVKETIQALLSKYGKLACG